MKGDNFLAVSMGGAQASGVNGQSWAASGVATVSPSMLSNIGPQFERLYSGRLLEQSTVDQNSWTTKAGDPLGPYEEEGELYNLGEEIQKLPPGQKRIYKRPDGTLTYVNQAPPLTKERISAAVRPEQPKGWCAQKNLEKAGRAAAMRTGV